MTTRNELIEILSTSQDHAAKLRPFRKPDLERFVAAQQDPQNHETFPLGSYVYCEWAGRAGIVTHTAKVPGRTDGRYNLMVKTGASSQLHTHSGDVIRF